MRRFERQFRDKSAFLGSAKGKRTPVSGRGAWGRTDGVQRGSFRVQRRQEAYPNRGGTANLN